MKKQFRKRIRINYIKGLDQFVHEELLKTNHKMNSSGLIDSIANISLLNQSKTINEVYLEFHSKYLNPKYISNHKSIIEELIEKVFENSNEYDYKSFSISVAGSDSDEIQDVFNYISNTFNLEQKEIGDLKIEIGYRNNEWVISCRTTPRPLSLRPWRVCNIEGGMNPTIAYCMNKLTTPKQSQRVLNIFSGSGTLLIERAELGKLKEIVGFDYNGKTNACAIQNIKQAGLIKDIKIKNLDIVENPDLGKFDSILTDLPFGIKIGKGEDLKLLYKTTVEYILENLTVNGIAILYTSKYEILEDIFNELNINPEKIISLVLPTSEKDSLYPRIYVINKS